MDLQPCWLKSQLRAQPDGTFAVQNPDGSYVTFLHDGSISKQPNGVFDQEKITFISQQNGYGLYLANRESYPEMLSFIVIIVG